MVGQLVVVSGPDQGRMFPLETDQTLLIGRGQNTVTQLKDPCVSRVHCQLEIKGNRLVLVDSGSTAGTLVNGKRIKKSDIKAGDVIRIGATEFRFQPEGGTDASTVIVEGSPTPLPGVYKKGDLSDLVGETFSHYRIESVLAKAQTGMVFKAQDAEEDRLAAVKVLWPEFSSNDEEMHRFIRAMKTMLAKRHPNLVSLYGAGKSGKYCWIAMEFVEGESATQVIERIGTAGMLDWRMALRVAIHIARALKFAEDEQIIHRNIKPSNILIRNEDKVAKLGDLMLAKALEGTLAEQITRPGELVGDVAYMSPERTHGGAAVVDCRSDLYSLGATVYALLTGRPPFLGDTLPETIKKIREADPVRPKKFQLSIPDLFEGVILKMLAKHPNERYQDAQSCLGEMERVAKFQGMAV
jgi:eukaryotic-like serine/threonine-protein kinase